VPQRSSQQFPPCKEIQSLSGDSKTTWHRNADIYHLTKACALSAHYGKVFLAHFFQPNNSIH
jgi:hypothetical protein